MAVAGMPAVSKTSFTPPALRRRMTLYMKVMWRNWQRCGVFD
jgi:hypothetical protein